MRIDKLGLVARGAGPAATRGKGPRRRAQRSCDMSGLKTTAEVRAGTALERVSRNARGLLSLNRSLEFGTLCRMLELEPADSLLDVGSGDGYWTERFARRAGQVTGLEPDDAMLGRACRLHDRTNIRYEQGVGLLQRCYGKTPELLRQDNILMNKNGRKNKKNKEIK